MEKKQFRRSTHYPDDDEDGEVKELVLYLLPTGVIVKAAETGRSTRKSLDTVTNHTQMWHGVEYASAPLTLGYFYPSKHGKRLRQCPGGRRVIRCGNWLTMV